MDDSVTKEPEAVIEPVSASADGKRNAFSMQCEPNGQCMNYAACLWRQGVLAKPDINTPSDWAVCGKARRDGTCVALQMRQEEEIAGKAIYFRDRSIFRKISDSARKWISPYLNTSSTPSKPVRGASAPARPERSMLDAMGDAGSLADAVSAAAKTPTSAPPTARASAPMPCMANTGESPLQMARRLAAQRQLTKEKA